jgi:hypothetical protein
VKPWPAALLERYPVLRAIPERPWWSGDLRPGGYLFRLPGEDGITLEWRQSGDTRGAYVRFPINARGHTFSVVYTPDTRHGSISTFGEEAVREFGENYDATMPMDTRDDLLKLLERLDRERPLPHPGFRTGQVWGCVQDGGMTTLQIIEDYAGSTTDPVHPPGRWFTLVCGSAQRLNSSLGDRRPIHVNEERLRDLFGAMGGFVLIADPCCPWLAPWSPA